MGPVIPREALELASNILPKLIGIGFRQGSRGALSVGGPVGLVGLSEVQVMDATGGCVIVSGSQKWDGYMSDACQAVLICPLPHGT